MPVAQAEDPTALAGTSRSRSDHLRRDLGHRRPTQGLGYIKRTMDRRAGFYGHILADAYMPEAAAVTTRRSRVPYVESLGRRHHPHHLDEVDEAAPPHPVVEPSHGLWSPVKERGPEG